MVKHVVKVFKVDAITRLGTCHVGYLPNHYLALHNIEIFNRVYLHVKKDYRANKLLMNQEKSICNNGLLLCNIIVNRQYVLGHNCLGGERIFVDENDELYGKTALSPDEQKEVNDRLEKYLKEHPMNKKKTQNTRKSTMKTTA
jgi:hypothetical protein